MNLGIRRLSSGRWEAVSPHGGIAVFHSFFPALSYRLGFFG